MNHTKYFLFFVFILFGNRSFGQSNEAKVRFHLDVAEKLILTDPDSSLQHALKANSYFPEVSRLDMKIEILQMLGDSYKFTSEYPKALKYYLKAKTMVDNAVEKERYNVRLNMLKADVRIKMGNLYLQLKNFRKSLGYQEQALLILEKISEQAPEKELNLRKLKVYNNMAAVFIAEKDYETALIYFRNALELNAKIKDLRYEGSVLNNIGICHLELKQMDLASHYFQKSLKIRKQCGDAQGQAQVLNNLGKNEVFRADFNNALVYFHEALSLSRETGNKPSMLISLESLYMVNDTLGNYKEALRYHKAYKSLNDQIFDLESKTAIAALEQTHQRERDKKSYELRLKQKESDLLQNLVIVVVLLLVLAVAILIIFVLRSRVKTARLQQEKLTLERENLSFAHKTLEDDLEFKERELTAKALYILKNSELITKVTDNLQKLKRTLNKDNYQLVQEIISDLQSGQKATSWDEFEAHFTRVHSQFYNALREKFPTLTSNEMKLCAFLRLNMSTKDISAVTNQSINSITVARTRLRKKLGIDGEEVHLINFLMTL